MYMYMFTCWHAWTRIANDEGGESPIKDGVVPYCRSWNHQSTTGSQRLDVTTIIVPTMRYMMGRFFSPTNSPTILKRSPRRFWQLSWVTKGWERFSPHVWSWRTKLDPYEDCTNLHPNPNPSFQYISSHPQIMNQLLPPTSYDESKLSQWLTPFIQIYRGWMLRKPDLVRPASPVTWPQNAFPVRLVQEVRLIKTWRPPGFQGSC